MLRIGLLGCGRHGQRYLRHLARGDVDGARAVAIWRRDVEARRQLAREFDVAACDSVSQLVGRDDVDAVVIATPPGSHRAEAQAVLAAGKPVLVEKPITTTVDDAIQLARAAAAGPPLMVAQTLRYNPALRAARETWARLGSVHRLRFAQRLEPSPLAWQRDATAAGGGSLHLTGVHLFDSVRWLLGGTPDAVQCLTQSLQGHPFENLFDACFEYQERGILASTEVSKFSASRRSTLDVVGTAGQLWVDYASGSLEWITGSTREVLPPPGDAPTVPAILADFARTARGEIASPIDALDGVETLRMIEACRRSAAERRVVALDEIASFAPASP